MSSKPNHQHTTNQDWEFSGFQFPTTTPVPDQVFDELLSHLSGAEVKVLLYICRRTFGFKKESDNISLSQIVSGIVTKEGKVLDRGTGLVKDTVTRALKSLEEKKVIVRTRRSSPEKGYEATTYSLNLTPLSENRTRASPKIGQGLVRKSDIQQTVLQETVNNNVVVDALQKFKIGKQKAQQLASQYPDDYIETKIEFLEWKLETKPRGRPVSDIAAWLVQAIEKDYQPPANFKSKAQREKKAEELARQEAALEEKHQKAREMEEEEEARQREELRHRYGTTPKEIDLWAQVLQEIELATTSATYRTWFPQTTLLSLEDGQAVIGVPNKHTQEWLTGRHTTIIQRAFEGITDAEIDLEFVVTGAADDA